MTNVGRPAKPAGKLAKGKAPGTKRLAVSLRVETVEWLDARAEQNHRSRTAEVEHLLDTMAAEEKS